LPADAPDHNSPRFCDYEGSNYRTAFWEGQGREYEDLAERFALRRLLPPAGQRIIDIGGGFGRLVDLYRGYKEIVLMDYSRSQLQDAQRRLGQNHMTYVAANLYEMPFAIGAFDTAVMVRVLHHLTDVPRAMRAIQHILRPGGTFVLEYANKRNLKAILRYLLRRQTVSPFTPEPWEFAPLNLNFHPMYVQESLTDAGFHVEQQLAVSHFRVSLLKRHVPARILATIDSWLQQPTAWLKCTPSMFIRSRTAEEKGTSIASAIFCCPRCKNPRLLPESDMLICTTCGSRWGIVGGIYDFKEPLDR
jgi:2-polyprenyl-3-methyl-5-hydroxy-6-metoxy-1,4-benzoquinol methylase